MFSSQDLSSIQKQQHKRDIKMSFNHIQSKLPLYLILLEIPPWLLKRQLLVLQNRTWAEVSRNSHQCRARKTNFKIRHGLEPFENTQHIEQFWTGITRALKKLWDDVQHLSFETRTQLQLFHLSRNVNRPGRIISSSLTWCGNATTLIAHVRNLQGDQGTVGWEEFLCRDFPRKVSENVVVTSACGLNASGTG